MKAISVRNLPDELYSDLRALAKANHRSMQEQVRYLLAREVSLTKTPGVASARQWRRRLASRTHSDAVAMVREDRER